MTTRFILTLGAVAGVLAVTLGAFGAHGLHETLSGNGRLDTFKLAVDYQFYHALALLATGILTQQFSSAKLKYAAGFFTSGILFFSGSLYILSLTNITRFGIITPIGGVFFILGWIFLIIGLYPKK